MASLTEKTTLKIEELNRLYSEGESCDKELFAEQRSNYLLSSGNHFNRKHGAHWERLRASKNLSQDQKLRITKNHCHVVVRNYVNNIVSLSPGVSPMPNDDKDLAHIKNAELAKAVWEYAKSKHNLKAKTQSWVDDFIQAGEVFCKIFFDPNGGRFVGYEQETDDEGNPLFDDMGLPEPSDRASFTGDIVFKQILPANVIRAAEAKSISESRFLCIREMVNTKDLKAMVGDDDDKLKLITDSQDETFMIFDNNRANYSSVKNQCLVKEFYFRPCPEYPKGWFAICTGTGILFEGELPYGVFPIVYEGFDQIPTTPRHRSILKQLRPLQSELNRMASSIAQHQVTLGEDKVILQNGSKVTGGPQLPGIRTLFVTGQAPTVMAGRAGDQYSNSYDKTVSEFYQIAGITQDSELKGQTDPWQGLYYSMRDKKKFSIYAEKFEGFLARVCETYLSLAKEYFDENMLIPAVGRSEYINIAEFKNAHPLATRIKVEPLSDDLDTMMGKTLQLNHMIQFSGGQLKPDQLGQLFRELPFVNVDHGFEDLTQDYDSGTNIILALDRGEVVQPSMSDNAEYILKRLAGRMKKADFKMLSQDTQNAYQILAGQYQDVLTQQQQAIKQAESQFIPSNGPLIKVDFQIKDPTNPARTIRAVVPSESLQWLMQQLEAQGSAQEVLQGQPVFEQAQIAQKVAAQGMPPRHLTPLPAPGAQGPSPQNYGQVLNPTNVRNNPGGF